jgi:transketolase
VPRLFPKNSPMRLGQARELAEGDEVVVISSGVCTAEALRAVPLLREQGIAVGQLHVSTLKPFADPTVLRALRRARRGVVTVENHLVTGGLGSAVAEAMAGQGLGTPLVRLGLQDTYAHGAARPYLLREYGLDAFALVAAVERLLGRPTGIGADDIPAEPRVVGEAEAKAEDL